MHKVKNKKNKILSIFLILLGILSICIEGDYTFFLLTLFIGIPLFFMRSNWIQ